MSWSESTLGDLNAAAQDAVDRALRAVRDPQPEDIMDEHLNGPETALFDVNPGDRAWLPVGQYLLQRYADGTVTLAWRQKVGSGSWGPPVSGRRV